MLDESRSVFIKNCMMCIGLIHCERNAPAMKADRHPAFDAYTAVGTQPKGTRHKTYPMDQLRRIGGCDSAPPHEY